HDHRGLLRGRVRLILDHRAASGSGPPCTAVPWPSWRVWRRSGGVEQEWTGPGAVTGVEAVTEMSTRSRRRCRSAMVLRMASVPGVGRGWYPGPYDRGVMQTTHQAW